VITPFRGEEKQKELEAEKQKLKKGYLVVRSERKNMHIPYDHITYVESVGNHLRIMNTSGEATLTKEKISRLNAILPDHFLRIHRSIVVNRDKIQSFNKEWITVNENDLPLSRKYKDEILKHLNAF